MTVYPTVSYEPNRIFFLLLYCSTYLKRYPAGHLYNSGLPFSILHSQNRAQSLACEKIPWFEHWKSNVGATITVN